MSLIGVAWASDGIETEADTNAETASSVGSSVSLVDDSTSTTPDDNGATLTKTVGSKGGTVVVSYRPGEVRLETAVPLPGFQVEIDEPGPPAVDVEFESSNLRVRIRAEWEDGSLELDIDESPEGARDD